LDKIVAFSYFFEYSLQLEVFVRKLKQSNSIAVVIQASQTAVVLYDFQVQLLAVLKDVSGYNCFLLYIREFSGYNFLLPFFKFNCNVLVHEITSLKIGLCI
jgi:hypothetical protein